MDSFRKSVAYEDDLPTPHTELEGFIDEERPSRDRSLFSDLALRYGSHVAGGMGVSLGLVKGLEELGLLESMATNDQMTLLLGPPMVGAAAGGYISLKKHEDEIEEHREERRKWKKAQDLERTGEDFSGELEDQDFVVVRDYLLGEGEPLERRGEAAAALYREASGLQDAQYFEDVGRIFPEVDYQLSLFQDGEPLRSFYLGEGLVDEGEESYSGAEINSLIGENLDSAVSLEDYR